MAKLLPPNAVINSKASAVPSVFPIDRPSENLPRRLYALSRNAAASVEGELAVIVPAAESEEIESSYFTAAITWGFEAVGLPIKLRGFMDILIELAVEDVDTRRPGDWFPAPDIAVGCRARLEPTPPLPPVKATSEAGARFRYELSRWKDRHGPTCPETGQMLPREQSERTLRAWAARERKKLLTWQQISGVTLVQVEEGDFDRRTRKNSPTRYRLLFVEDVAEALRLAKTSDLWRRNPLEAIRKEARALFRRRQANPTQALHPRRRSTRAGAKSRLDKKRKMILSLFRTCRDDLRELSKSELAELADERFWFDTVVEEARSVFDSDSLGLIAEGQHVKQGGT